MCDENNFPFRLLVGHNHAIMDICISSDDEYLVTASRDCTLKAWHLPTLRMLASFDCQSQIKYIDLVYNSEDRYRLAAENKSGTILILDLLLEKADRSDIRFVAYAYKVNLKISLFISHTLME